MIIFSVIFFFFSGGEIIDFFYLQATQFIPKKTLLFHYIKLHQLIKIQTL